MSNTIHITSHVMSIFDITIIVKLTSNKMYL